MCLIKFCMTLCSEILFHFPLLLHIQTFDMGPSIWKASSPLALQGFVICVWQLLSIYMYMYVSK